VPVSALLLAFAAAFLHASWNMLLAGAKDSEAATAVALVVAAVVFAPVAAVAWDVERAAWPYIAASAALELAYFILLAAAYHRSELGLVYPLARGVAPVLVLLGATIALGRHISTAQAIGVVAVGVGVILVRGLRGDADTLGTILALVIAVTIAGYTLVDKEGMNHAGPLPYLELVLVGPAILYALGIGATKGRGALRLELRWQSVAAGIAMFSAFALILAALQRAPAAPVAAVRETGVVIATGMAALILHERVTGQRLAGAFVVVAGVALIALG
jgi:drug/metabolite transporter (DMT)-like permease